MISIQNFVFLGDYEASAIKLTPYLQNLKWLKANKTLMEQYLNTQIESYTNKNENGEYSRTVCHQHRVVMARVYGLSCKKIAELDNLFRILR